MSILNMSLAASLAILAVIVLRSLFIHILPKKTFIFLWGIVIIRLLAPVSLPSRLSIWNMVDTRSLLPVTELLREVKAPVPIAVMPTPAQGEIAPIITAFVEPEAAVIGVPETTAPLFADYAVETSVAHSLSLFFWLWLAGVFLCIAGFLLPHLRWQRVYRTALPVESGYIRQWTAIHPLHPVLWPSLPWRRKISVKQSDMVISPLTFGILKPVILLPKVLDLQDETCLSYILTHEYVHIRRMDTFWKWILALTLALHWFNPLVWLMYILANRDIELSCDETVVRKYGENVKSGYAMTLIALLEKRKELMSLSASFSRNMVEERIVSIMKIKKISFFSVLLAFLLISGITMVFATSKSPQLVPDSILAGNEPIRADSSGQFIRIPGGTYIMGPVTAYGYGFPQENQHEVTVGSFYLNTSLVTQREYEELMDTNPADLKQEHKPVVQVSWFDAIEYCNRLSQREGLTPAYTINGDNVAWDPGASGYRLPTEAEWEYAARAGTNTPFGSDGSHPWGINEMPGSIWEWCWDWYGVYPDTARNNPAGADSGTSRVMRGGQWYCARSVISTLRSHNAPSDKGLYIGFRLVHP